MNMIKYYSTKVASKLEKENNRVNTKTIIFFSLRNIFAIKSRFDFSQRSVEIKNLNNSIIDKS